MKPTVENLRRIALDEELKEKWAETRKKQLVIEEKNKKHRQYLLDNDMEHLIGGTGRYWPPLSVIGDKFERKMLEKEREGAVETPIIGGDTTQYPSGYMWNKHMLIHRPYAQAVVHYFAGVILFFIALALLL
tara:strand:+ start:1330 stop:1725 length:396 start_codon:yes stop_codon:yes gene_type:complete